MKNITFALIVFALLVLNGSIQARASELINIQFQSLYYVPTPVPAYTGKGVIGGNNDIWNQLINEHGTKNGLLNASGVITPATITWEGSGLFAGYNSWDQNGFASGPQNVLMNSYLYSIPHTGIKSISFGGLTPNTIYDLFLYTEGDLLSNGRNLSISIVGGVSQVTTMGNDHDVSTFIQGQNFLVLPGVTDPSGGLSFTYTGVGENVTGYKEGEANINAIQLALRTPPSNPVPEPTSIILFGTGIAGWIGSRLRKKK
jgi:hypothetical protein